MKKNIKAKICAALFLLAAFALWTWAVSRVDVLPIGPQGSAVGFASVNRRFHQFTGVHWGIYTLTDWLGLIPIATAALFGLLGLCQWVRRKSLRKVDPSLFLLAGFYGAVMAAYVLFEIFPVNYRPVLIEGVLEASYPSSTTLLMLTVLPTAALQLRGRIRTPPFPPVRHPADPSFCRAHRHGPACIRCPLDNGYHRRSPAQRRTGHALRCPVQPYPRQQKTVLRPVSQDGFCYFVRFCIHFPCRII